MSEKWNIAILGATGAVGSALLETLEKRNFPVKYIFALARTESVGMHLRFLNKLISVQDASRFDWTQAQLAFFAASREATKTYIYDATKAGCLVIDLSGLFALEPNIPLVMPDLNSFIISDSHNIIAVPNSLTSQLLTALKPFINISELLRIEVISLLSTSAYGKKAIADLAGQSANLLNGIPINANGFFGRQMAFNILPVLPDQKNNVHTGYRIVNEVRKILQNDKLMISAICVQSPVFYGHAQIVNFKAIKHFTAEEARNAFISSKEINLREDDEFPTQVDDAINNSYLFVGCVHNDYGIPEQIQFWSVADNIRFGGALIAIKIAEKIIKNHIINVRSRT